MSVAKTTKIYYGKFANTYEIELHRCRLSFFSITCVHSMRKGERKLNAFLRVSVLSITSFVSLARSKMLLSRLNLWSLKVLSLAL